MIQQAHLTAWQAHAPWDKRSKIEQDLRLSRAVAAIFSDGIRTLYEYVPLGLRYPMTVKVEVNLNERRSLFPFVDVRIALLDDDGELQSCAARSYDINEMLGTKLRALMQRRQGRDLFDLYYAARFGPRATPACSVEGVRVIEAFTWYLQNEGTQMRRAEAEQRLADHLKDRGFRADMSQLLRHDFGPYDVDAAAALVRGVYLAHLS